MPSAVFGLSRWVKVEINKYLKIKRIKTKE